MAAMGGLGANGGGGDQLPGCGDRIVNTGHRMILSECIGDTVEAE